MIYRLPKTQGGKQGEKKKEQRFTVAITAKSTKLPEGRRTPLSFPSGPLKMIIALGYTALGEIAEFLLTSKLQKETEEKRAFFGRKIADLENPKRN